MHCRVQGVRLSLQQAEMELAGRQQQMVAVEARRRDIAQLSLQDPDHLQPCSAHL